MKFVLTVLSLWISYNLQCQSQSLGNTAQSVNSDSNACEVAEPSAPQANTPYTCEDGQDQCLTISGTESVYGKMCGNADIKAFLEALMATTFEDSECTKALTVESCTGDLCNTAAAFVSLFVAVLAMA